MALRIGIDVGGTFTHGVVLEPPGSVIARARTPTTHTDARGVAAGVEEVLRLLLAELPALGRDKSEVELVAHSTTQATNALLEGDLSGVHLLAIVPPGERGLVARALRQRWLDIGGGHQIRLWPKLLEDWQRATVEHYPDVIVGATRASPENRIGSSTTGDARVALTNLASIPLSEKPGFDSFGIPPGFWVSEELPVAVVQPLAGKHENREHAVAQHYRACGHPTVAASDITQVLGLAARARTAVVNAAMLPTMLATADYTEKVVRDLLPTVPLQVVRSDGGAMSIAEMRRQPILSLLSGPAAGASAALHRSGLSDAVFIEVGGTSTDITLIKDGRVRHRYATVGGQRLMVPALDLRTVAVGGGSMYSSMGKLRTGGGMRLLDKPRFGPRSAHIAGLPYLFQALTEGRIFDAYGTERQKLAVDNPSAVSNAYFNAYFADGSQAAYTLTDHWLSTLPKEEFLEQVSLMGLDDPMKLWQLFRPFSLENGTAWNVAFAVAAYANTLEVVAATIRELVREHDASLEALTLIGGGGGAPAILSNVAAMLGLPYRLIPDHAVISAIGAALAVTCVSLSRHCAQPTSGDIAGLVDEVEARLAAQGAERVQTDYEFDVRRQVLTVTGRGSRPYDQDSQVRTEVEQRDIVNSVLKADPALAWQDDGTFLWTSSGPRTSTSAMATDHRRPRAPRQQSSGSEDPRSGSRGLACATDRFGRVLWQGRIQGLEVAAAGRIGDALDSAAARYTQHTDGGAVLPHLGLLTGGRYIPLDQLGSPELIAEVLRWEKLPADAQGCFVVGKS